MYSFGIAFCLLLLVAPYYLHPIIFLFFFLCISFTIPRRFNKTPTLIFLNAEAQFFFFSTSRQNCYSLKRLLLSFLNAEAQFFFSTSRQNCYSLQIMS